MIHEHQVRERAYFIWQSSDKAGDAVSHWAQAEAELRETLVVHHVAAAESLALSPAKALKTAKTTKTAAKSAKKADAPKASAKPKNAARATTAH